MWSKTHILVFFVYAAALFLHSEGVPIPVDRTLQSICKATKFPDVCISVINSGVMGRKVDALSALKANIKGATEAFKSAKAIADTQARLKTTPPAMVPALKVCKDSFRNALSKLKGTKQCIVDRNGFDLNALLAATTTDVDTCSEAFKKVPNVDQARLVEDMTYLREIITNSLSLAEQFIRSKPAVKSTKPAAKHAGRSSVSRPKPTSAVRGSSRSRPAATPVNVGLSSICKQTMYPDVCASTIAPLLKGGKVDTVSALKAEMQVALASFQQAKQLVEKAIAGGAKAQMNTCHENYESALRQLEEAQKAVVGGNNSVGVLLTAVSTDAQTCIDTVNERPGVKSPVPIQTLEALVQISSNCLDIMRQIRL